MYIIELFFKLKEKVTNKKQAAKIPRFEEEPEFEDEKCEHIFSPIDSTNTVLACVKCGYLIHCSSDEFKKKNIFKDNYDKYDFDKPEDDNEENSIQ